ncbi:FAD-dependent monooxygenase [uncultured Tateyamaria sp.]|uniref:FAD-dependent monooxygenase n=1 Tax=uncultured Tateyamaria sp. TaxID=455651 RepID=UPI002620F65B|nr:FAD-dependent monooxygenase [uncultured Tateyamaria sp.]
MQYHQDGFRPGDPALKPAADRDIPPDSCDILIVGTGPAGLTLAAYLAQFPHIRTRIVEQRDGPLIVGQADGIACRTMEMFAAFGFAHQVLHEAYHVNETTFWRPAPQHPDHIARADRIKDVEDGLSDMPHVILSQARVQDFYLDLMRKSATRLEPDYDTRMIDLTVPEGPDAPVSVTLETNGTRETISARFVVGCDGARSQVRRALGVQLRGEAANAAWGVMDVLAVTDFPDIRFKCAIQSSTEGSLLIIPREGGHMVRLYIELDKLNPDERVADRDITPDRVISAAQRILHPYHLDVKEVAWWSVYEICQRISDSFSDVPMNSPQAPRVFIAGDACHTHSPKAGQGMNVSMADAFNLGWKLQSVIEGRAGPALLHSYSAERRAIAQELIDFDKAFAAMFASGAGRDGADFQRYFQKHGRYTAGVETRYAPSLICGPTGDQHRATGFEIGTRFHSAPVIRWADAYRIELGHTITADGRWRVMTFAGRDPALAIALAEHLADDPAAQRAQLDLRLIVQSAHRDTTFDPTHTALFPATGRLGLRDKEKLFCPDPTTDIFDLRGIDRDAGALVLVRPDQYVAHVLPLTARDTLTGFLETALG